MPPYGRAKKLDGEALWEYALRVLGRQAQSVSELERKLLKRAAEPSDVAATIAKLREYGMVDDCKFSEAFASARVENEAFGRLRVLRDLRLKRVPRKIAETAVEKAFSGVNEQDLLQRFLARKYRGKNLREFLKQEKNLASAYRRLRGAGFSSAGSLAALKQFRELDDTVLSEPGDEEEQEQ